ncbi:MAG: HD domain-containing phosphohydrolase [Solirubrobacterales bacterium]
MNEYYDYEAGFSDLRDKIVGLGEHSIKKSYYPELQKRLSELEYIQSKNKAILEAIPDLLMLIGNDGKIIDCSIGRNMLLNISKNLINKNLNEIEPDWIYKFYNENIKDVFNSKEVIEYEYRYYFENVEKYCEIRAVNCGENDILLIFRDITESKKSRKEIMELNEFLKKSEYTFRTLFEGSSDTILLVRNSEIIDCNPAALELFRCSKKENILGKNIFEISTPNQPDGKSSKDETERIEKLAIKNGKYKFEWWLKKFDETVFPVEVMLTSIILNGNMVLHASCRDISERKKMEHELEYLSYHDQLTGLYNRRFFEEELKRMDVPRNYPLTLVVADVNGLKLVNDSFGHIVGDKIIIKIAHIISKACRADDIVARFGGDEYVMLLPSTSYLEAGKIIKRIKDMSVNEKVESIALSASFGWATKDSPNISNQEIFKLAEDFMYKQKLYESPSMRGKTITAIIKTLNEKNKREEAHSHRVSAICADLAKALNLSDGEVEELRTVGLFHDIGKIAIEESILNKEGKLLPDEWEQIKRHPEIGYRILSTVNEMAEMAEYVLAHHEKWNGTGYPKGLKNEEIPFQSRIIAIADAFDAMTSERTYKNALTFEEAEKELERNAGIQFDPKLIEVFIKKVSCKYKSVDTSIKK